MIKNTIKQTARRSTACRIVAAALAVGLASVAFAQDKPALSEAHPVTAITKPSKESKLSFAVNGIITDVKVKEGDPVKAGQPLMVQDVRMDEIQYKSMKLEGDSTHKIEYSKADHDLKKVEYERKKQLFDDNRAASPQEVEEARLAVQLAQTQIDLAVIEHQQKQMDADRQGVKVDLMTLSSKFDGVVAKINQHEGEAADPQNRDGAMVVVNNDPLWIEMHLPTAQSALLKLGQTLDVKYVADKDWQPAKIIFFAPEADATSDTQLVRLELSNKDNRASGLQMLVRLPENVAAAAPERATAMNP